MDATNDHENDENQSPLLNNFSSFSTNGPTPAKKRKHSMGGSSLLEHELKVLKFANDNLKKLIEEMEEQQNQKSNDEQIIQLETTIKRLEVKIDQKDLQHKAEMDSLKLISDGYLSQIKVLEDEKQTLEEKVKELSEEVVSMKAIKTEVRDTVEEERENVQNRIDKLNAEINAAEGKINDLENELTSKKEQQQLSEQQMERDRRSFQEKIDEMKEKIDELQEKNNEAETKSQTSSETIADILKNIQKMKQQKENDNKKIDELEAANKLLDEKMNEEKNNFENTKSKFVAEIVDLKETNSSLQKTVEEAKIRCDETEAKYKKLESNNANLFLSNEHIQKQFDHIRNEHLNNTGTMKEENDELLKKNTDLLNEKTILQNSTDELNKKIVDMGKKASKTQFFALYEVADNDLKINLELMACRCKRKQVLRVHKIKGEENGMKLYSRSDPKHPYFIKFQDFWSTTLLKLSNIREFVFQKRYAQLDEIVPRINVHSIRKIHLCEQNITSDSFCELVSSEKVETCILEETDIDNDGITPYPIYKIIEKLPKLKKFRYEPGWLKFPEETAKELAEKFEPFPDLQKFHLFKIPYEFDLGAFSGFVKKNPNACYILKYGNLRYKYMKTKVEKNKKTFLDSLSTISNNIYIVYD